MRHEIRIAGFGGQGVVLAGIILGRASAVYDGKKVVQTSSYGPEARGGAVRSEVIISADEIDYPLVKQADVFVAMSMQSLENYLYTLKQGGLLIVESDLIKSPTHRGDVKVVRVPATKLAEDLGNRIVANAIMLGVLVSLTQVASKEAIEKAIRTSVPSTFVDLNIKAFELGYDFLRLENE